MKREDFASQELAAKRTSGTLRPPWSHGLFLGLRAMAVLLLVAVPVLAATVEWTRTSTTSGGVTHPVIGGYAPTATLLTAGLNKGKVLVVGGYNGSTTVSRAYLFDPGTNKWLTTGQPKYARAFATATELADGRVLIAGGFTRIGYSLYLLKSAEIYTPSSATYGTFTNLSSQMSDWRELFSATRLPDGRVLLVGGKKGGSTLRSADLFDPGSMTFGPTGEMQTASGRFGHDAVVIPADPNDPEDLGKVLVVGGKELPGDHSLQTAELYDIKPDASGTFTSIDMLKLDGVNGPRDRPRVAWIPSVGTRGMALVVGGKSVNPLVPNAKTGDVLTTEWFDPTAVGTPEGPFFKGPDLVSHGRMAHTLTPLGDGSFLAAGGWSDMLGRSADTAERFVPSPQGPLFGAFVSAGSMWDKRQDHDAAPLQLPGTQSTYRVLVVGGKPNVNGMDSYLSRAEIYKRP